MRKKPWRGGLSQTYRNKMHIEESRNNYVQEKPSHFQSSSNEEKEI